MDTWKTYQDTCASQVTTHITHELNTLRYGLIETRKRLGIKRELIAQVMGVDVSNIEKFEAFEGDPRLSEILWYASTIGVEIDISLHSVME